MTPDPTAESRADRQAANIAVLRHAFAAMATGDADAVVAFYSEDYVLELPYGDPHTVKTVEGVRVVRDYLAGAFEVFRFELLDLEVHPTEDPDLIIAEYRSAGRVLQTGAAYANRYVGFWWFRDGEVVRTREYYNPVASQLALAGEEPGDLPR